MDKDTKIAVDIEIEHIEELYGRKGLILAMELLKKRLDNVTIDGEFYCDSCGKLCYIDEGKSISTMSGIQAVCPSCYDEYKDNL